VLVLARHEEPKEALHRVVSCYTALSFIDRNVGGAILIQDRNIGRAVSQILQRAERQEDPQKILGTFVDVGFLPQLDNRNNQIFYGRRGTGKTHVLRVLSTRLKDNEHNAVSYIDCRTLGSTSQFSDPSISLQQRCTALFRDFLGAVYNPILEHIFDKPSDNADKALEALDNLSSTISEPVRTYREESFTQTTREERSRSAGIAASADLTGNAGFRATTNAGQRDLDESTSAYKATIEDKVLFPALHQQLTDTLRLADCYLYILIDEWSSLPNDIQPYFAEFLKRGVLPVQRAVVKIASLEYRSRFSLTDDRPGLGFELGADISTAQDLDDYYVFDRNPEQVTDEYADMLFRHLSGELPEDYLGNYHRIRSGKDLSSRMFTDRKTFKELARASEGVVRDLINIFSLAFNNAYRRGRTSIDRKALLEAARQWFERDKVQYLDEQLQTALQRIVDEVIGARRARSFLLPRQLERHVVVQRLFDARVLHHMQRGYADKDNPGIRYNIYTVDYGTYVDLMGTSRQPVIELFEEASDVNLVVPFDDKRSIRRIILNEKVLS
jgi:hypothetical protein